MTSSDICGMRTQLVKFLRRLNVETLGVLCPTLEIDRGIMEFDPSLESQETLHAWLLYRGFAEVQLEGTSKDTLVSMSIADMADNGNFPPFADFLTFNPRRASVDFLRRWLSWYGITSPEFVSATREWWEDRAQRLLSLFPPHEHHDTILIDEFKDLEKLQQLIIETNEFFFQLHLCFNGLSDFDLDIIMKEPLDQQAQEVWDKKKVLALALDAAAVAVPIVLHKTLHNNNPKNTSKETKSWKTQMLAAAKQEAANQMFEAMVAKIFTGGTGKALATDVGKILLGGNSTRIPTAVISTVAKKYLANHPEIIRQITNVVVPNI